MNNPNYQSSSVRYSTPSSLQKLQGEVNEVSGIMRKNIEAELERGAKLDDLESKSDMLNEGSRQFAIHSKTIKKNMWWANCRTRIIIAIVVLVIIAIIVAIIVVKTKK